jgi:hypothetical protein
LSCGLRATAAEAQTPSSSTTTTESQAPALKIEALESPEPYFDIQLAPGESKSLRVKLSNVGRTAVPARTYAADASTSVNGGLTAKTWGTPKTGATTWTDYADEELELQPGQEVVREFKVAVPADALPGEYITSVAVENRDAFGDANSQALRRLRQVVAIQTTVPGDRAPSLAIKGVSHDVVGKHSIVIFHLANDGNVRLEPAGTATVTDSSGRVVASAPLKMGSFYAHNVADLELPLEAVLHPGKYKGKLELEDAKNAATAARELPFVVESTTEPTVKGSAPTLPGVNQTGSDTSSKSTGLSPLVAAPIVAVLLAGLALLVRRRSKGARSVSETN